MRTLLCTFRSALFVSAVCSAAPTELTESASLAMGDSGASVLSLLLLLWLF